MDIRPPTSGSCSCFSFPPLCLYSQLHHQVVDSEYISWSPQGIHASAGIRSAEHPTLSPRARPHALIPPGCMAKMSKGRKRRGGSKQLTVLSFIYFLNLFLSRSLPISELRTVGSVQWSCLIMRLSLLREIEGPDPTRRIIFYRLVLF